MKKRGIFSLLLMILLIPSAVFADVVDIGTAGELIITSQSIYGSGQETASYVSVITSQDIERMKPQTTADLISRAIGIGFRSHGALGAVQSVQIRGSKSSQVEIYLDGVLMDSAHNGQFDLNSIPISSIDHIEIIRSGTGSLGKAHTVGGMINIITKKGTKREVPFTLSVEARSFLPELYEDNNETKRNWIGLADALKIDLSYQDQFDHLSVAGGIGVIGAQNNFTYEAGDDLNVRNNSGTWGVHGHAAVTYDMGDGGVLTARNLTNFSYAGVPGSTTWLTDEDYQRDVVTTSSTNYHIDGLADGLLDASFTGSYTFNRTFFYMDFGQSESIHNKHRAFLGADQTWYVNEWINIDSEISLGWDGIDSTQIGKKNRYTGSIHGSGTLFFHNGTVSLHPTTRLDITNDFGLAPGLSIGLLYGLTDQISLQMNTGYSYNAPTFSELYWPDEGWFKGNPDLDAEKAWLGDVGIRYETSQFIYEGTLFIRDTRDLIVGWPNLSPENSDRAVFLGTEQELDWSVTEKIAIHAGYILNYSWDLSGDNTISSNERVAHVRMHTVHGGASYGDDHLSISVDARYLGHDGSVDPVFLVHAVVNWKTDDTFSWFAAVDNLFNSRYELANGYPMPGIGIRLGSSVHF